MEGSVHGSTIAEVASTYGISYRTLRFYEQKGFLQPLRVGATRVYTSRDRIRLELILKGKKLGFSLEEIWHLVLGPSTTKILGEDDVRDFVSLLSVAEVNARLQDLQKRRLAVDAAILELREALAMMKASSVVRLEVTA